ncbi:DUF2798 domain-containing protein [Oryzibacter oryziterrae]|uniref:DUF2798 domain-containing protein n=1 Tax=Oryzibacter oryziterrae TaxID=2766474 RepID=UPI001F2157B5|nr:DUF2798 domain-containing protein [Oryzibacter oryziterrae]
MPIFPARAAPILFGFLLSGFMSLMVSGIATYRSAASDFVGHWMASWLSSWLVAFPVVLVVAPLVRRIVGRLCASPA